MNGELACRLGVDVGGTFTDLVLLTPDGSLVTRKVLSTSGNYAEAIFAGIADVLQEASVAGGDVKELIHGTTVATNAIMSGIVGSVAVTVKSGMPTTRVAAST